MKSTAAGQREAGFSLVELLCVIAIIGILTALLLEGVNRSRERAKQAACLGNLKEMGIGFHAWAHDHGGRFSMQVPMNEGGTLEYLYAGYSAPGEFFHAYRHFQVLSNQLITPKLVLCPADRRRAAANFAAFENDNLSYFVTANAQLGHPGMILTGDRNLTNDWVSGRTLFRVDANNYVRWSHELHRFRGNLLFGDGHVELSKGATIRIVQGSTIAATDLVLPTSKSESVGKSSVSSATVSASDPLPLDAAGEAQRPPRMQAGLSLSGSSGINPEVRLLPSPPPGWRPPVSVEHPTGAVISLPGSSAFGGSPDRSGRDSNVFNDFADLLRDTIIWGYLLLLIVFLLLLGYALWRRHRRGKLKLPRIKSNSRM